MVVLNQTLFKITFNWDRTRFEASRHQCRIARKCVEMSINVQFEKQMRGVFSQNIHIEENINASNEHLLKYHDKLRLLDNMIDLASQSLIVYFEKRMETVRTLINEHCQTIQQIIQDESEHWKEIHAVLDQNLINPGDIRSRNNYPKSVQKSPASNIQAIDEADEEESSQTQILKLMNGKTITPLLTRMIRKSRLESKQSPALPAANENIDMTISRENSVMRKHEHTSLHILPLSTTRPPLKIVDTTFVIKPEEANLYGDVLYPLHDEANGTYRAVNPQYLHEPLMCQDETSLLENQPQIPARLCFSPTILHDPTVTAENQSDEDSSSSPTSPSPEHSNVPVIKIDRFRFGQTFVLDTMKKESMTINDTNYIRPAIGDEDDDVVIILHVEPPTVRAVSTRDAAMNTTQEPIPVKSRIRIKTKSKPKSVMISTRKTRSATQDIVERVEEIKAPTPTDKSSDIKRKTRKRKPSKSIERVEESSDEDKDRATDVSAEKKRKPKKRKGETENEETQPVPSNHRHRTDSKRKTRSKTHDDDQQETIPRRKTRQRAKTEERERIQSDHEEPASNHPTTKRKKTKAKKKTEDDSSKSRTKTSRKIDNVDDQTKRQNTRRSIKRETRSTRTR